MKRLTKQNEVFPGEYSNGSSTVVVTECRDGSVCYQSVSGKRLNGRCDSMSFMKTFKRVI